MRIISGKYGHRRFQVPTNITARPTTDMARESLFNVLGNMVDFEGLDVLDLFAGTGAVSFEFLSRGAASVTSVEKAQVQYGFICKVKAQLRDDALLPVRGDVFRFMATCKRKFDVIFADPPYDLPTLQDLPSMIMASGMVRPGTIVVVEHSKHNDFSALPQFVSHRNYGKVNFTFFKIPDE